MQLPGECVFSPAEILPALLLEGALVQRERRRLGEVESVELHQFLKGVNDYSEPCNVVKNVPIKPGF